MFLSLVYRLSIQTCATNMQLVLVNLGHVRTVLILLIILDLFQVTCMVMNPIRSAYAGKYGSVVYTIYNSVLFTLFLGK